MKKVTIFLLQIILFLIGVTAYAHDYKSSKIYSKEEINYIEKMQEGGLKIGANIDSLYVDIKNPEDSLAHKYESLLEDFFHIDAEIIIDEWKDLYQNLKKEEIDLLLDFTLSENRKEEFNLSIPIHGEKLYVISNNKNISLDEWRDLSGKEIAVLVDSSYSKYMKEFKKNNNLNFKIKEVDSFHNSKYDYAVSHTGDLFSDGLDVLELADVDPMGIGLAKSKVMLKKIIDKALKYSHKAQLLEMLDNEKTKRKRAVFYKNLTKAEKKYLEGKEKIEILVDSEFYPIFYYDKNKKTYDGIFSRILNELSLLLDTPVEVINLSPEEPWNSMYERFKKGSGDMTIMYFTPERGGMHNFSEPLEYTDMILVSNGGKKNITNMKIGVVQDDISEKIALKYFSESNKIIKFERFGEMIDTLKDGRIDSCVIDNDILSYYHQTRFDLSLEKIKTLEKMPICFAVQRENDTLLSIINKATDGFIDRKGIKNDFFQELLTVSIAKKMEENKRKNLILSMVGLIVVVIAAMTAGSKYILHKNLHKLAYYDHLTTALNRISFEKEMDKINFSRDGGLGMYIDLNGFKLINDNSGHHAGDMILKEVVCRLKKVFKNDLVYRLAGDEFFVFLKDTPLEPGINLAKQALKELKTPMNIINKEFEISVSIGICELDEEVNNLEDFLHRADIAMYTAKDKKDGGIVVATNKLVAQFEEDKNLEKELKKALYTEGIIPYFQPKVDLQTNDIVGIEALARWIHPERGIISPVVFIPLAEKTGLIQKLDFLIAESTIKKLKKWIDQDLVSNDFKGSFNISVKTFEEEDVYEQIKFLLNKYDLPGKNIEVEVTENIFINKLSKMLDELKFLKEDLGASIALDDFTAGHASLRGLSQLTVDTLKFDKSLLQIIKENSEKGKNIYSTLVKLSKDMGYTSVAEGIENVDESDFLKKEGVDYGQGFYFAKPMAEDKFVEFIGKRDGNSLYKERLVEIIRQKQNEIKIIEVYNGAL
ncbi:MULTISPECIES: EAL domain-containing protein [Psychrilyobacter]|uniref:EAL domain-containing protein n=1 Tax=Psychrilyobacter piezotolerans TaxID=2293438 RepID=A0ABX9KJF2_9FUSO|nr:MULTISPECIES: EAL domain-containing protein [Psychrilyobacter]MCS5421796.1 EAL domain-containing protein [Psychrilyobacter sp. S5]NDI77028.1 EAL domain-containing protein [Psychrilyobacter piezotolerans]RDE64645.1 EAL domain-containing protein [Psychrilyobacter sp. S5]REI42457.1 EAL domain-containing protein [Psychrilyobacter piezotolerans]